ncbi:hypothetical protein OIK44_04925 [Janthinobacterium sp. hw3]|uniref:Uncharacterized protein n=1 Tax=Janthinobacterium fluminis TaxID=2987524 RepID=A0ABT5JWJ6_9BURK|nr:hypothetical protein [Janthinobacterium fluminis]
MEELDAISGGETTPRDVGIAVGKAIRSAVEWWKTMPKIRPNPEILA